ncbi:unnamed protein product, partial [Phaeothamnion confervicola]
LSLSRSPHPSPFEKTFSSDAGFSPTPLSSGRSAGGVSTSAAAAFLNMDTLEAEASSLATTDPDAEIGPTLLAAGIGGGGSGRAGARSKVRHSHGGSSGSLGLNGSGSFDDLESRDGDGESVDGSSSGGGTVHAIGGGREAFFTNGARRPVPAPACERCCDSDPLQRPQLLECMGCHRRYHTGCVGEKEIPFSLMSGPERTHHANYIRKYFADWRCPACLPALHAAVERGLALVGEESKPPPRQQQAGGGAVLPSSSLPPTSLGRTALAAVGPGAPDPPSASGQGPGSGGCGGRSGLAGGGAAVAASAAASGAASGAAAPTANGLVHVGAVRSAPALALPLEEQPRGIMFRDFPRSPAVQAQPAGGGGFGGGGPQHSPKGGRGLVRSTRSSIAVIPSHHLAA